MPSSPASSSPAVTILAVMSMNTDEVVVEALLTNTRTTPLFSTTNQRELSPGACSSATGSENDKPVNARGSVMLAVVLVGGSNAKQVVLLGRVLRPRAEPPEKVAVTEVGAASAEVVHVVLVPEHPPPLHPPNVEPLVAAAVSVTVLPSAKLAAQVDPQLMPAGADVTVPAPVPALATVSVRARAKVAVTFLAALMVTEQEPVPVHAPLQPLNNEPEPAAAVSVTAVFCA